MMAAQTLADSFGKGVILSFEKDNPASIQAFKLDSDEKSDKTRAELGLGSAHIADYLWLPGYEKQEAFNHAYIIEATNLKQGLINAVEEYHELAADNKGRDKAAKDLRAKLHDAIIDKYSEAIRGEVFNKLYGTLLLFCRIGNRCSEAEELLRHKKFTFVVIKPAPPEDPELARVYASFTAGIDEYFWKHIRGSSLVNLLGKELTHPYSSFVQKAN